MDTHGDLGMRLADIIEAKRVLLLDFDGPICHLFSNHLAPHIAETVRDFMLARRVESTELHSDDPLELLRIAYLHSPTLGRDVENYLIRQEVRAALSAEPTVGAIDTVRGAIATDRRVVVVSNNSERAVRAYLNRHGLTGDVSHVLGRPFARPDRMKPDPYLVQAALVAVQVEPAEAVFVGDSVTDILAGRIAEVDCIGYAKSPDRASGLVDAEAVAIISRMADIAEVWN